MNRLPNRIGRRIRQEASSSVSKTSISETTDQLVAFWQRRFGRGGPISCSECDISPACIRNAYDDFPSSCPGSTSLYRGGHFQSLLRPYAEDPHRVEYATCSSSTLIFTLMAFVSAFLVLSVTVVLVRVKPIVDSEALVADATAPVAAPRDFTLTPPKPVVAPPQALTVRPVRLGETVIRNVYRREAEDRSYKPPPRVSFTQTGTISEAKRWATVEEVPLAVRPQVSLAGSRTTAAMRATSRRSSFQGSTGLLSTKVADTYVEETLRMCSVVLYSYCSHKRQEFYFVPTNNSCVAASADTAMVCNHSPNRFTSEKNCKSKCIDSTFPSERCFTTAIFSRCTSRDVRHQWWFFDGSACVPWDFPSGACPSIKGGGDLFNNMAECVAQCAGGESLLQPCQPPKPRPCTPKQLRFPYFAVSSPEDRSVTCTRASVAILSGHSCLTGTNRFYTEGECREACTSPGRHSGPVRFKGGDIGGPLGKWRTLGDVPASIFDQDFFTVKTTKKKMFFFGRV